MTKIKVKLNNGNIYNVVDEKDNLKIFNDCKFDSFFVECNPEESPVGFNIGLVDKKDVIEVIGNDKQGKND